jgi:hypothetical protein
MAHFRVTPHHGHKGSCQRRASYSSFPGLRSESAPDPCSDSARTGRCDYSRPDGSVR